MNTRDLLEGARNGDDEAWELLYRRYRAYLAVMVRVRIPSMVRRRFDTDDVLQSAFVSVWTQIESFEYQGEGSFRNWLARVVVNSLKDNLRYHGRAKRSVRTEQDPGETADLDRREDERAREPADCAEQAELQVAVLSAMSRLPDAAQEVICMRDFEHFGWTRIADLRECSESTARRAYEDAYVQLTRELAG